MNDKTNFWYLFSKVLRIDFVRFCIVGATGFLINLVMLRLLHDQAHMSIFPAQAISAELAYLSNFLFHRFWTFQEVTTNKTTRQLLIQFHASVWSGLFLSTVIVWVAVSKFHITDSYALVASSVAILFWNFFWTKFYVWKAKGSTPIIEPNSLHD